MRLVIKGTISLNRGLSPIRSKSSITFVMEDFFYCVMIEIKKHYILNYYVDLITLASNLLSLPLSVTRCMQGGSAKALSCSSAMYG